MTLDAVEAGDVVLTRSDLPEGCYMFRDLRKKGARVYVWVLGYDDEVGNEGAPCSRISSSPLCIVCHTGYDKHGRRYRLTAVHRLRAGVLADRALQQHPGERSFVACNHATVCARPQWAGSHVC